MNLKGQGATRSRGCATYCPLVGQGATEYLVLLAVVLIVALVSVALLGFFPGMASDAQITQTQAYWKSASPIAIVDSTGVTVHAATTYQGVYLKLRNTGAYRVAITKILANGGYADAFYYGSGNVPMGTFPLSPGEEMCIYTYQSQYGSNCDKWISISGNNGVSGGGRDLYIPASGACDSNGNGMLNIKDLGFEYTEYVEGQQITKREIGAKPFMAKCIGIY